MAQETAAAEPVRMAPSTLRGVRTIAVNTFKEGIRKRFMLALLVFSPVALAAGLIYSSRAASGNPKEAEMRMLIDSSISSIRFIGMLMAVFLGASMIPAEIERRTIFTILAKPISRGQIFLGKYMGAVMTVIFNALLMAILFLALVVFKSPKHSLDPKLLDALLLLAFELSLITAIAVTLSVFSTVAFNLICSFFIYFVGHLASNIRFYSNPEHSSGPVGAIAGIVYHLVPHFENFDIRRAIMEPDITVPWVTVMLPIMGYAILYGAVVLVLGYIVFTDKEF